jgi:hypothetical protein
MQVSFGPLVSFQYRLSGPGAWDGAADAISKCNENLDISKIPKLFGFEQ